MSGRDVVFTFWNETWTDAVERQYMPPDRLVQTLLTSSRVGQLLVADPFRSAPRYLARKVIRASGAPFPRSRRARLVSPLRISRHEVTGQQNLSRAYREYDAIIQANAGRMNMSRAVVITCNPFYAAYAPLDWADRVTYYAWDDWTALNALERWHKDLEEAYRVMAERGTQICAVSQTLLDRIRPTGLGTVVPNGIVASEWNPPWTAPAWMEELPRPRLLYAGAIHERLNTQTIREISVDFPNASIVIVGPVQDTQIIQQLEPLSNVHIHPPVPHAEVANLIRSADICIMPHHRTALTESMSPLKVYEYCATGRSVVATDLPPVRGVSPRVRLVPPGGSFKDAIQSALKDPPLPEGDRLTFLTQNSWTSRHQQIMDMALA